MVVLEGKGSARRSMTTNSAQVVEALERGEVILFPTETVYGIGASLERVPAILRIYDLKARPSHMPLMLHVTGPEALNDFGVDIPSWVHELAQEGWPGPLTLIVRAAAHIDRRMLGGGETVALRHPANDLTQGLVRVLAKRSGRPAALVGTSANPHGSTPPTDAAAARTLFSPQDVPLVLDGGPCSLGIESTLLLVVSEEPTILRAGAFSASKIEEITGRELVWADHALPGRGRVVLLDEAELRARKFGPGDAVLARFSPVHLDHLDHEVTWHDLGPRLEDFGRGLYSLLAKLEAEGHLEILVQRAEGGELSRAINARLERLALRPGED